MWFFLKFSLIVNEEAVIKDLSANLQTRIKEKVKTATDLEVKEVNITVKKVAPNIFFVLLYIITYQCS